VSRPTVTAAPTRVLPVNSVTDAVKRISPEPKRNDFVDASAGKVSLELPGKNRGDNRAVQRSANCRGISRKGTAMAKYGKKAQKSVKSAMHRRKRGTLRSGKSGKKVKSRKQAIAIGLSEARRKGAKVPPRKKSKKSK
jgi:hypothetical protein